MTGKTAPVGTFEEYLIEIVKNHIDIIYVKSSGLSKAANKHSVYQDIGNVFSSKTGCQKSPMHVRKV